MLFRSVSLHQDTVQILIERYGNVLERLYPPQIDSLAGGLLSDKNLVISFPTATGKTLLAEICFLEYFLKRPKKKMLYLAPLKALSAEKLQDFKYLEKIGIKLRLSTGDYDQEDIDWQNFDLLITTNEKLDSLIRNNPHRFRNDIGLVVVDEIHLLDDFNRGPTLEVAIVKLRMLNVSIKILALSATISNAEELAQWLNASLIQTSWRSVPILEGITIQSDQLFWFPQNKDVQSVIIPIKNTIEFLIEDTIKAGGQVLIFTSNRKKTEQLSQKVKDIVSTYLSSREHTLLENSLLSLQGSEIKDPAMDLLGSLIPSGVAFHHAGLSSQPRELIESLYRDRLLKVVIATPTLAAGINLPARRVIIESIWRYSELSSRLEPIKVMEYEQMRGRCGRPQYDSRGETIIIVKNRQEFELVKDRYLSNKGSEAIKSKLATENSLRMHILGAIASGIINSYSSLLEFTRNTLYGFQYGNDSSLESKVIDMLEFLSDTGFIRSYDETIEITALGKRVANLYIDPLSAYRLLMGIVKALNLSPEKWIIFSFLHLFCTVPDLHRLRIRKNDWNTVKILAKQFSSNILTDIPTSGNMYERFLSEVYTAESFRLWIEEEEITTILESTKINLGDFHRIVDIGSWISYSAVQLVKELYQLRNYTEAYFMYFNNINESIIDDKKLSLQNRFQLLINYLESLEIRFKYGIKEDLLPLISLNYIGRVRARILANNGIFLDKLSSMTVEELSSYPTFGPTIARTILEQLRQKEPFSPAKAEPQVNLPTTFEASSPTPSIRKNDHSKSKHKQRQINDFL